MSDERLQQLIEELDAAVLRDGARVRITGYGGGPHETLVVANKSGYLRLGVEMLKAAYARSLPGDPRETINVDLGYLLLEDENDAVLLNWFQRREPEATPVSSYRTDWGLVIMLVVMLALFGMTIVGVITTLNWLRSF